jgi:hypothetical protein
MIFRARDYVKHMIEITCPFQSYRILDRVVDCTAKSKERQKGVWSDTVKKKMLEWSNFFPPK